jgi:uncharacterized protein YbgA (DUF1722 family)/uncharacterized protein YbbK (DUF523 family)
MPHPRPALVISKCLELQACRYDGQMVRAPFVRTLIPFVELAPICPEVEIGLGIPRPPIRLVRRGGSLRLYQPDTQRDVTPKMLDFNGRFLGGLHDVDGFILKSRSPSCGIKDTKVYGGAEGTKLSGKGAGTFGGAVLERFPVAAIEDERRLTDSRLRHHFLTKLFARASFRAAKASGAMAGLVRFHTENELLLRAYHQGELRTLGRIVANADRRPFTEVVTAYEEHLARALARPPRSSSNVNVLMHAVGYVSAGLSGREKRHFQHALDEYREGRTSLSSPLVLLQAWIEQFDQPYLRAQTYVEPYPPELMDLRDSARAG